MGSLTHRSEVTSCVDSCSSGSVTLVIRPTAICPVSGNSSHMDGRGVVTPSIADAFVNREDCICGNCCCVASTALLARSNRVRSRNKPASVKIKPTVAIKRPPAERYLFVQKGPAIAGVFDPIGLCSSCCSEVRSPSSRSRRRTPAQRQRVSRQ